MATYIFNGECPSNIKQAFIDAYKPAPAYHADTWYKYAGDIGWRTVNITGEIRGGKTPGTPTTQIPNVNNVVALEIGSDITSIGRYAFTNCTSLTSVTIPDSVTSIGNSAFYYCSWLTSVMIGNSVTSIGDYAFGDCYELTSVVFKGKTLDQVEEMEYYPWGIEDESFITVI